MKTVLLFFLMSVLSCNYLLADVKVLTIGISDYPETSGWNKINAHNDVELMKTLFPNAIVLENATATRTGIESELRLLSNNAAKGDTVIIHFSGHGQQIITKSSSEEVDGVDEALVPFDAAKRNSSYYYGQNHLTDDEFGNTVDRLRQTVGPTGIVFAVIDACHSDSMDKDADEAKAIYRGTNEIFGVEGMSDEEITSLHDAYHNQDTKELNVSDDMSDVIYLSACRSDQRNYEVKINGKGYGSLTYYFYEAYNDMGLSDLSSFLSAIHSGMKNDKTLQFHGQEPAIRNTIGWKAPDNTPPPLSTPPEDPKKDNTYSLPAIMWSIVGATLLVIIIALWITKRKKR